MPSLSTSALLTILCLKDAFSLFPPQYAHQYAHQCICTYMFVNVTYQDLEDVCPYLFSMSSVVLHCY